MNRAKRIHRPVPREARMKSFLAHFATLIIAGSAAAQVLSHWSFEGDPGTPGANGTWWQDKVGSNHLSVAVGTPSQRTLSGPGPGASFPNPLPNPGAVAGANLYGLDASGSNWIRTQSGNMFNRPAFTFEAFVHFSGLANDSTILQIRDGAGKQFLLAAMGNGMLRAYTYRPSDGAFITGSTLDSGLVLEPNKDYYVAVLLSTGALAEERFVQFYVKNLTDNSPMEFSQIALADSFTNTYQSASLHLRLGESPLLSVLGDVRYSNGILNSHELLIANPPTVAFWTFQGSDGVPGADGTWWKDKSGPHHLAVSLDSVSRYPLPDSGPGAAFPRLLYNTGQVAPGVTHGLDAGYGWLRTADARHWNRNRFTVEGFLNVGSLLNESMLFKIRDASRQQFAMVAAPSGRLRAYVYDPGGAFVAGGNGSTVDSTFPVVAGRDYYFAVAVSTGSNAADRFVDFHLRDLTGGGLLQSERIALADGFTALYASPTLHVRIGESNDFGAVGPIRYSDGVLSAGSLLISGP